MTETRRKSTDPVDDPMVFWTVEDLKQRGIITSRTDLWTKQKSYGFPKGLILGGKRRLYRASDVKEWVDSREALDLKYMRGKNRPT